MIVPVWAPSNATGILELSFLQLRVSEYLYPVQGYFLLKSLVLYLGHVLNVIPTNIRIILSLRIYLFHICVCSMAYV